MQRSREIGVRRALGALPRDVVRRVLGQGTRLAGLGIAFGLVGALALTRLLRTLLFEVSPLDLPSFAGAVIVLLGIAVLASWFSAWRASRTDPQAPMRLE